MIRATTFVREIGFKKKSKSLSPKRNLIPKRLQRKHFDLFNCIEYDSFSTFLNKGYYIYQHDTSVKNMDGKTPLYFAVEKSRIHCS